MMRSTMHNGRKSPSPPAERLPFQGSPQTTLGVELELQIVDRDNGELVPGATRLLEACEEERLDNVVGEFLLSMVEVKTDVCRNVSEVRENMFPTLRRVKTLASALGYDLAIGATHPFSRASMGAVSPDPRYQKIRKRQGWLAYQEAIFGLHVHVGVPNADSAMGLINLLTPYLPHLLALSANSPFWQGLDTEFASCRSAQFRPSPHAGIPQQCDTWDDFCEYYRIQQECGALESTKDIYWDIRPRHDLGTIEFRVCDAPASLSTMLGLASLVRCMVIDGLRVLKERPEVGHGEVSQLWAAAENKARAGRFGLAAEVVRRPGRPKRTLADDTANLIERLMPVAQAAGEAEFLSHLLPVDIHDTGAERQRRLYRQTGSWTAVIEEMKGRWVQEVQEAMPAEESRVDALLA
jgi:carboxylate-amine ligase